MKQQNTLIKLLAGLTAFILTLTIIGIPIAVIILQLDAILKQLEKKS